MKLLFNEDFDYVVNHIPKDLKYQMEHDKESQYIIAGGFIRSLIAKEPVNDVDVFCINEVSAQELADKLCHDRCKQHITENAITVPVNGYTVQIIHKFFFSSFEELFQHFDFTIAQAAISYSVAGKIWINSCEDRFYQDLAAKRLRYTNPSNPEAGGSMLRILKFVKRGYTISMESLAEVIGTLTSVEPECIKEDLKTFSNVPPANI